MARKSQKKDKTKPNKNKESSQINKHPCFLQLFYCQLASNIPPYIPLIYCQLGEFFLAPASHHLWNGEAFGTCRHWGHGSADVALRRAALELRHKESDISTRPVDGTERDLWNHRWPALEGFLSPHSNWDNSSYIDIFDNGRPVRITKSSKIILMRLKKGV